MVLNFWTRTALFITLSALLVTAQAEEPNMKNDQTKIIGESKKQTENKKQPVKKKIQVKKRKSLKSTEIIPPKQEKAMESSKKGGTSPSFDPDHPDILN